MSAPAAWGASGVPALPTAVRAAARRLIPEAEARRFLPAPAVHRAPALLPVPALQLRGAAAPPTPGVPPAVPIPGALPAAVTVAAATAAIAVAIVAAAVTAAVAAVTAVVAVVDAAAGKPFRERQL